MAMIKGIAVTLYEKKKLEKDGFNHDNYEEIPVVVENVLVAPVSSEEVIDQTNLCGKKATYTLAIPKGDEHCWENAKVEFFGEIWETIGFPIGGIENLIPLGWNRKISVRRYG